jgi:hypothetical protein
MSIHVGSVKLLGVFLLGLTSACGNPTTLPDSTAIPATPTTPATAVQERVLPTSTARPEPTATFEPYHLPLSDYGPHFIGKRYYSFEDSSRNNRPVGLSVWYPAIKPTDFSGTSLENADPDTAGAPYALILSSAKMAGFFAPHLVTHGFVVVGIRNIDTYAQWDHNLIDQPLDILFALDQVGSSPLAGLEGIIDSEHAGAMGYSFDGYNSLAMSGARVDPEHFLASCGEPSSDEAILFGYSSKWQCPLIDQWDEFTDLAGESITASEDGLWQPMTDARLLAVMPFAMDGWLLFGEHGLGAVDRPVLILVGTKDIGYEEGVLIFENLGALDRFLISFVGQDHMMIYNPEQETHMKHFAAAFFGFYLQGHEEYADYFSEEFILQYPALDWGT